MLLHTTREELGLGWRRSRLIVRTCRAYHTLSFSFSYEFELHVFEITVCSYPYPSVKGIHGRGWLKHDRTTYKQYV